ncbi:hypothetical protein ALP94_00200 [Pseudomonas savastanoi pv. glycinea]|nr:hypothetical protein ALP94_00200 [Pseudomonas savastanoi pv. glycinea]
MQLVAAAVIQRVEVLTVGVVVLVVNGLAIGVSADLARSIGAFCIFETAKFHPIPTICAVSPDKPIEFAFL